MQKLDMEDLKFHYVNLTNYMKACIDQIARGLSFQGYNLYFAPEFLFFDDVISNMDAHIAYLSSLPLETEFRGFRYIKSGIRTSCEAMLDLYNLVNVPEYLSVLLHNEDIRNEVTNADIVRLCGNKRGFYTIVDKWNMAKKLGGFDGLIDNFVHNDLKDYNKCVHASPFRGLDYSVGSKIEDVKKCCNLKY